MRPLFLINFEGMPFQITGELTWLIAGKVNTAVIMNFALVLLVIVAEYSPQISMPYYALALAYALSCRLLAEDF